jgi:hypothetical protein
LPPLRSLGFFRLRLMLSSNEVNDAAYALLMCQSHLKTGILRLGGCWQWLTMPVLARQAPSQRGGF